MRSRGCCTAGGPNVGLTRSVRLGPHRPEPIAHHNGERRGVSPTWKRQPLVASAGHGIALAPALRAYLQAFAANLVSAGVRLIPLGQTDGQRVLAALEHVVAASAERASGTALDEVGGAAFRADIAGMRHEMQHTRLFRS